MSRRQVNPSRRYADSGTIPLVSSLQSKSRSSPYLTVGLIFVGALLFIGYSYSGSVRYIPSSHKAGLMLQGGFDNKEFAIRKVEGGFSCTTEVLQAIPVLKSTYGDSMHKILHVGPDTCSVVSNFLKEKNGEAWGVDPYDIEDADSNCKNLVLKGFVRVADIKFLLPYRGKSFSHVIVSDALDYLSPKYLNTTLPELARVATNGLVIFTGYPGQQRSKVAGIKFGRPAKLRSSSWWKRFFVQIGLQEDEAAIKKFGQAAGTVYKPSCQIFHLRSYH